MVPTMQQLGCEVVWLLLVVALASRGVAGRDVWQTWLDTEAAADTASSPGLPAPLNVSDVFRGTWASDSSGSWSLSGEDTGTWSLRLQQRNVFHGPSAPLHVVQGRFVFQAGPSSDDTTAVRMIAQGVYYHGSGHLLLLASPLDEDGTPVLRNCSLPLNMTDTPSQLAHRMALLRRRLGAPPNVTSKAASPQPDPADADPPSRHLLSLRPRSSRSSLLSQQAELWDRWQREEMERRRLRRQAAVRDPENHVLGGIRPCYMEIIGRVQTQAKRADSFANMAMYLKDKSPSTDDAWSRRPDLGVPVLRLSSAVYSPNCRVQLTISGETIDYGAFYRTRLVYALLSGVASVVVLCVLVTQMESIRGNTTAAQLSMLTFGFQGILDGIMCLFHFTLSLVGQVTYQAFNLLAFVNFATFAIFGMSFILQIWRARPNADGQRISLGGLYLRFYSALFFGFGVLCVSHSMGRAVVLVLYSFWLPQIFSNASMARRPNLSLWYIVITSVARLMPIWYFYGYAGNFLHFVHRPRFTIGISTYVAVQAVVLLLQRRLGPNFFMPKATTQRYDYSRELDGVPGDAELPECVVCMTTVEATDVQAGNRMVTPCEHVFHRHCLLQWMDVKLECPTCRRALPIP